MKKIFYISAFPILVLSLMVGQKVEASQVTGSLNTTIGATVVGVVITPPIATPAAGVYASAQSVTLSAPGSTSINYTTDGTLPTCTSGTVYSGAIVITSSTAIQVISCYPNNITSTVASDLYGITIPNPVAPLSLSGSGGGTPGPQNVLPTLKKADTNSDGKVDVLDFVTLMADWGKTGTDNLADLNGDGTVDILDFVNLMANWTN